MDAKCSIFRIKVILTVQEVTCISLPYNCTASGIGLPLNEEVLRLQNQIDGQKVLHVAMAEEISRLTHELRHLKTIQSNGDLFCEACECRIRFGRHMLCIKCDKYFCRRCIKSRHLLRKFGIEEAAKQICNNCAVRFRLHVAVILTSLGNKELLERDEHCSRRELELDYLYFFVQFHSTIFPTVMHYNPIQDRRPCTAPAKAAKLIMEEVYATRQLSLHAFPKAVMLSGVSLSCFDSENDSSIDSETNPSSLVNLFGFVGRGDCHALVDHTPFHEVLELIYDLKLKSNKTKIVDKLFKVIMNQGIPNHARPHLWWVASEAESLRMSYGRNFYSELCNKTPSTDVQRAIQLDVNRTFIDHELFQDANSVGETSLYNILMAYAVFRPDLGYGQGMNFLAATIIIYFKDEEEAFWVFFSLMYRLGFERLYDLHFQGISKFMDVISSTVSPALFNRMNFLNVPPSVFAANWMLTIFTATFECWEAVLLIWDLCWLLPPSSWVPFRVVIALLSYFGPNILECSDSIELMVLLQRTIPQVLFHTNILREILQTHLSSWDTPLDIV